ncbi:MAG: DUF4388 domain-containing protein [Pseudanabaenaceae cyanobacterium]|jgi:Domain of unknown function (DUF4388)
MAITGSLQEYSLPEIFQFLDRGQKTGQMTIRDPQELSGGKELLRHIWFHQGRVVAAGTRMDGKGLLQLIEQRGWLSSEMQADMSDLLTQNLPLGVNLKTRGFLDPEQLKFLFSVQVLRQVCALFQVEDGLFHFEPKAQLPKSEMTGLSLPATETTLMGLRSLKNWEVLASKLPEASSTLFSLGNGNNGLRLDRAELAVQKFADGILTLNGIAKELDQPIEKVRQIAFRLIVVGLAEEVPTFDGNYSSSGMEDISLPDLNQEGKKPDSEVSSGKNAADKPDKNVVSQAFLQNLVGFLQQKL